MSEQQPSPLQQRVSQMASEAIQKADPYAWFEPLYAEAQGDTAQIPWARLATHPYLQDWLGQRIVSAPKGAAIVVGCGLGDDAEALAEQGFQVTAFDISPTAIAWCRQRFPNSPVDYQVADLFHLSPAWQGGFELVFECRNVQALPLNLRTEAITAVASLVAPQGSLLVVTHLRPDDTVPDGPPWPLSNRELAQFEQSGLQEVDRKFLTVSVPAVQVLGLEYRRPG
ncbi:SAM-dependent methyltransferase [Leptolyngbya sp. 'hensonii']|uniref:class I SAM-dependent methyltransferase n=1 Tax=Leptolyngbya sp. 'hensonii' TaxID=1922337 RepID=UPI00094FB437|nr:class I SAM-dependent methyltransferase [Leptolyngbya sp. 'hensonii']OLP19844.1 SAM-dependent methyltransferase [Leptolyngbya sp. 'hensonii']